MADINAPLLSLNAGCVSKLALGRVDLAKLRMAMEIQENLLPKVLGPASFRPGTAFQAATKDNATARLLPFVFNASTTAELELTANAMRVLLDGQPLTRPAVTAAVTNGSFATDLSGWTVSDEVGASSAWSGGGVLVLTGTGDNAAILVQDVVVHQPGVEHALRIVVDRGPVTIAVGISPAEDDLVRRTQLRTGEHSIAFTPSGTFRIRISSTADVPRAVSSVTLEAAGTVVLATPWGADDIRQVRTDQSGDVLFCACAGHQQRRIERRSQRSWSVVTYDVANGPFLASNASSTTIAPSGFDGIVSLTASKSTFRPEHVGALFRLTQGGQHAYASLAGDDQYTSYIRVTGVGPQRAFIVDLSASGTWAGTLTLQRSLATPGAWTDIAGYTVPGATGAHTDGLDNQIVYYRIGFKPGQYTSGVAEPVLVFSSGEQTSVFRVVSYDSATLVYAEVLKRPSRQSTTANWAEGAWSGVRGWPSAVRFHDGRLWWAKDDMVYGSVSDAFDDFDAETEGDSAPIARSIATGGFERINWLLSLQRLIAGTEGQEVSIRSSSFDEPLTPTQFTARTISTRGAADLDPVRVDSSGVYAQRSRGRVLEVRYSAEAQDYSVADLTRVNEDICQPGVVELAVQREPETRIWVVLEDGTCAVLTYERTDEVVAWASVTFPGGFVESVCATPGEGEDRVSFVVRRTVAGNVVRFVETLAHSSDCIGGDLSKNLDSHILYSGAATTTISGLGHLEGEDVAVWGDGQAIVDGRAPVTVTGGAIALPTAVSEAVIGIPYGWRLKSAKLAYGARQGSSALFQRKRVSSLGILAADFGWNGLRYGNDFTPAAMRSLPSIYRGQTLAPGQTLDTYDYDLASFPGGWDTDARVCIEGVSPYPATLLGLVIGISANERGQRAAPSAPGNDQ